jgi:NAD(P)-dependent dehydrogenase (short-subunit alcohol dehydrogenase family)
VSNTLEGRVVIVTGGGRGIGRSVARLAAQQGARVVVNDLGSAVDGAGTDAGPAQDVVQEIKEAGGTASSNPNDVSDYAAAGALVQQAIDQYGQLDVLVNVAGILRDRMLFNMEPEEWDAVIRVHLRGTFSTTRHAAAYWRRMRNRDGHFRIINFTSVAGLFGAPSQPNYAAAKMGIVGFTYSCANGLAQYGVTANVISPGALTRMTDSIPSGKRNVEADSTDEVGVLSPDNVAPAVAYVASEASDWITGQVIHAQGTQVGLYSKPELIAKVAGPKPLTVEEVFAAFETTFRPKLEHSENFYEVARRAALAERG